jgi:hypothetical protein
MIQVTEEAWSGLKDEVKYLRTAIAEREEEALRVSALHATQQSLLLARIAALEEALAFYAADDGGCSFADYDVDTKRFGKHALAALTQAAEGAG